MPKPLDTEVYFFQADCGGKQVIRSEAYGLFKGSV